MSSTSDDDGGGDCGDCGSAMMFAVEVMRKITSAPSSKYPKKEYHKNGCTSAATTRAKNCNNKRARKIEYSSTRMYRCKKACRVEPVDTKNGSLATIPHSLTHTVANRETESVSGGVCMLHR